MRFLLVTLVSVLVSFSFGQVIERSLTSDISDFHSAFSQTHPSLDLESPSPRQAIVMVIGSGHSVRVGVMADDAIEPKALGQALAKFAGPGESVFVDDQANRSYAVWRRATFQNAGQSLDLSPLRGALKEISLEPTFLIGPARYSSMVPASEERLVAAPGQALPKVSFQTRASPQQWQELGLYGIALFVVPFAILFGFTGMQRRRLTDSRERVMGIRRLRNPLLILQGVASLGLLFVLTGAEAVFSQVVGDHLEPNMLWLLALLLFGTPLAWAFDKLEYQELRQGSRLKALLPPAPQTYLCVAAMVFGRGLAEDPLRAAHADPSLIGVALVVGIASGLIVSWLVYKPWVRSLGVPENQPELPPALQRARDLAQERTGDVREIEFAEAKNATIGPVVEDHVLRIPKDMDRLLSEEEFEAAIRYALLTNQNHIWRWPMGYAVLLTPIVLAAFAFMIPRPANFIYLAVLAAVCFAAFPHVRGWLKRSIPARAMHKILESKAQGAAFDTYIQMAVETGEFKDYETWAAIREERREIRRVVKS